MARHYVTRQNEMLDAICRRIYGDESGYVEKVLDANPGLAARSMPLPMGIEIVLPELALTREAVPVVYLWD
ncbi:tail protein X [Nitratireductor sp.]|uniref:tail protein X n=1 Tax=Nitratireductor sp. TaxID=1872084 RepID=UPI002632629A|nr:tail protein X [Nitratireductor sp.]MCV0378987.1 tail protein X [Nitratireductor sp.]